MIPTYIAFVIKILLWILHNKLSSSRSCVETPIRINLKISPSIFVSFFKFCGNILVKIYLSCANFSSFHLFRLVLQFWYYNDNSNTQIHVARVPQCQRWWLCCQNGRQRQRERESEPLSSVEHRLEILLGHTSLVWSCTMEAGRTCSICLEGSA